MLILRNFRVSRISCAHYVLFWIVCVLLLSSCARTVSFHNSSVVPAAEGYVKVKKDANKNYQVEVILKRLAQPERLSPPRKSYVVWVETKQNGPRNIGQIKSSTGLFSSELRSSLKTVTAFKPVSFFVTAEDEPNVQVPGTHVVLRTKEL